MSDAEVIERIRSGDSAIYETLMRRYNQRLFRIARSILRSDSDAEDAVQNTYIQGFFRLDQFRGEAAFATWITRIAIRQALAIKRRRHGRDLQLEVTPMHEHKTTTTPEGEAIRREIGALIEGAVDRLPDAYRIVFVMREVEHLSTAETAEALEISEENVKVRLHRSRTMLRRELYEHAGAAVSRAFSFDGHRCDRIVAGVFAKLAATTPV